MDKENKKENKRDRAIKLAIICLILFLLAAGTSIVLVEKLNEYADNFNTPTVNIPVGGDEDSSGNNSGDNSSSGNSEDDFVANPHFEVVDGSKVWTTDTDVDIFGRKYYNKDGQLTVDGGPYKVIAPGTGNNYTFKCVNNGNVAIDYTVSFEVTYSDAFHHIPVQAILTDSMGRQLTGLENGWVSIEYLNGFADSQTLAANRHINYTLSWQWPFEGDDHYDTALGDIAVNDDLKLIVRIKTIATENPDPNAGIGHVNTGDSSNIGLWISIMLVSFMILIFLVAFKPKKEKDEDEK